MADPKARSVESSLQPRSTAQQVVSWLTLVSLVVALVVMGAWWISAAIPLTASTTFLVMFATIGVWVTIYRLFVLGIKQLVRGRIEKSTAGRG